MCARDPRVHDSLFSSRRYVRVPLPFLLRPPPPRSDLQFLSSEPIFPEDLPIADRRITMLSIPPPIQPKDPDSPSPGSILLDPYGYLSDRTNATTANGCRSRSRKTGKRILVTFWMASPPRVSCFTVHCPDLKPCAFGAKPKVVCADDDLVLLRIAICPWGYHMHAENIRYFVYEAGKPPSLKLVHTHPDPDFTFSDCEATLLRCRDQGIFYLAVLCRAFIDWQYADDQFHLHVYNSKTQSWSTKLMHVDCSPQDVMCFCPNKVITIGGERRSVGWVDLSHRCILICDLLHLEDDNQYLRYIPLPSPLVPPKPGARRFCPLYGQNIIVLDGYIKYFEMHKHVQPASDTGKTCISAAGWVSATKKMEISSIGSGNSYWEEDCAIKSSEVPVNSLVYAQMLLQEEEGSDAKPTLKSIYTGYPALSLHDRDVVYIMSRPDYRDDKACVIALDMRSKTVKGVADFCSGRHLGFSLPYFQCEISKHLGNDHPQGMLGLGNAAETGGRDGSQGRGKQVRAEGY